MGAWQRIWGSHPHEADGNTEAQADLGIPHSHIFLFPAGDLRCFRDICKLTRGWGGS